MDDKIFAGLGYACKENMMWEMPSLKNFGSG